MKNIKYLIAILVISALFSCSDTIVTKQDSSEIESTAPPIAGFFKKNVLIEDFTGTWCGNCATVLYAIDQVYNTPNNNTVVVAVHSGNDPFKYLDVAPYHQYIFNGGIANLPEARLNRTTRWVDQDTNINKVLNLRSNNCGLGLLMNSNIIDGAISLDVKMKFAQNYSNLKLVVYLLEDKLLYKQTNYSNYFGGLITLQNFEHNHVMRKSLTDVLGNSISETIVDGTNLTKNFSLPIPTTIANADNISFVAFLVDSNNTVINVRSTKVNEIQAFEENL